MQVLAPPLALPLLPGPLLAAGADAIRTDANGWGCIHHAAAFGSYPNLCVGVAVAAGASINGTDLWCQHQKLDNFNSVYSRAFRTKAVATAVTLFHATWGSLGVFYDLVKELHQLARSTPLIVAVKSDNLDFADMIVREFAADVDHADALGNRAVHFAARRANQPMIENLRSHGANLLVPNLRGARVHCCVVLMILMTGYVQAVPPCLLRAALARLAL